MVLSNLHTNWIYGSYINDRDYEVKVSENDKLRRDKITDLNAHVSGGSIDVGYGYDLFQNLGTLQTDLEDFVTDASDLDMVYQLVDEYVNHGNPRHFAGLRDLATKINKYFDFGTETQAAAFLAQKLNGFESTLNNILGYTMDQSREKAALMSICYNTPGLLTDPDPNKSIANAVGNDDRIRAWYLIRYRLNGGEDKRGVANRRYRESDMFGLWGNGGPTSIELEKFETFLGQMNPYAPNVSMLQYMRNYEALFTPKTPEANSRTIDEQINNESIVKSYFVTEYAPGATIDGNVIIGTELNNTVIPVTRDFTKQEVQNGFLKSTALNDLILGGIGNDKITGGAGNDTYSFGRK